MVVCLLESHEVSMCSRLYHLTLMNHSYDVRVIDGRETVSDDNGCSTLPCFIESFLDDFLALRIEGRGGLIEKEDLGVSDESSCNGDSLLLSTAQLGTLATNISGIALYKKKEKKK